MYKLPFNIFVISILFFLLFSCKTATVYCDLPRAEEQINIKLLDSTNFTYEYYFYDGYSANSLIHRYCKGVYYDLNNNIKLLVADTFNNFSAKSYIYEDYINTQKNLKRFIVKTNIFYDFHEYKSVLFIDSTQILFNGPNIDTLINIKRPKKIKVEISLTEDRYNKVPKASFKNIITKEIFLKNYEANCFNIKIPISGNTFNYKIIEPLKIKDMGEYYLMVESMKKATKN